MKRDIITLGLADDLVGKIIALEFNIGEGNLRSEEPFIFVEGTAHAGLHHRWDRKWFMHGRTQQGDSQLHLRLSVLFEERSKQFHHVTVQLRALLLICISPSRRD